VGNRNVKGSTGKARANKRVTKTPPVTPKYRYLVWRFGRLDHETSFSCGALLHTDVRELEKELAILQREPISTLLGKRWLKFIGASEMTPEGQKALAEVSKQENGLWQLHLKRYKWRVWGYFDEPEFSFLFWDAGHEIATGKSRHRKT
jgi:hypothetical protein